jgi:hypothetical protein
MSDLNQSQTQSTVTPSTHELSDLMKAYLREYKQGIAYEQGAVVSPIEVDELASKLAKLYEKVRRIIDWKEENLVRRTAIERILKRTLLSELSGIGSNSLDPDKITEPLIMEMIRSGYFSKGRVSKNKIPLAKESLAKYIYILNQAPVTQKMTGLNIKEKVNFYNWILEIAACEIEEILEPAFKENALMTFMTSTLYERLKIKPKGVMTDEEILVQTYIAVHRSLFSLDAPIITYNLIKYYYPRWFENNQDFISEFTQNIEQIKQRLEVDLEDSRGKEFFKICDRYDAAFLIIGDVMKEIEDEPEQIETKLSNKSSLFELIEQVYTRRLSTLKQRLYRSAVYSTLSIFVAGIVSFIIFEGPIAEWLGNGFSWFALVIDLGIPSALMFLLVITIKGPGSDNLARVKAEIQKIVYQLDEQEVYEINFEKKSNWLIQAFFSLLSLIGGVVGAYAVYMIFKIANVPWTSIYIDTINVAMVVFAAMVIRHKAQELAIQDSGGVLTMMLDFFYLPLAKLGQWFSEKWKEYNIVSVFFSALIDAPFSMVVSLIEDWRAFLRDRRSEIH